MWQKPPDPLELLRQAGATDQQVLKLERGGKFETQEEICSRSEFYKSDQFCIPLGSAYLPEQALFHGIAYIGSSGAGKTVLLNHIKRNRLLHVGMGHGHRVFIWDFKGRERWYLDTLELSCPVYYVNPVDERGVGIDLAAELTGPLEADAFAADVIMPPFKGGLGGENSSTFLLAAQAVFAEVIKVFQETAPGNWGLRDVLEACRTEDMLRRVLPLTRNGQALIDDSFGANKQAKGIMLTLQANCNRLMPIAAAMAKSENISLRQWVEGLEEAVIVLQNVPKYEANLNPFFRWVFKHTLNLVMSRYIQGWETYTFFIDEARWTPFADELTRLATLGRDYRAGFVLGFQDVQGMEMVLTPNGTGELFSCCSTQVWMQNNNPATARFASERFGQQRRLIAEHSGSLGQSTNTNAPNLSPKQRREFNEQYFYEKRPPGTYTTSSPGWGASLDVNKLPFDERVLRKHGITPAGAPISDSETASYSVQATLRVVEEPMVNSSEVLHLPKINPFRGPDEDLITYAAITSTFLGNWLETTRGMQEATINRDESLVSFQPRPDAELRCQGWTHEDEERLHVLPPEKAAPKPKERD